MSSEDKEKKTTPFEKARLNIKKTAQNFNFYNSVEMLAFAIQTLNKFENECVENHELDTMCRNIIIELSEMIANDGDVWN
jgi:hypothetical protein